jgi:hypothetical protein
MNAQREVIYKRRRFIWERLKLDIANMLYDTLWANYSRQ